MERYFDLSEREKIKFHSEEFDRFIKFSSKKVWVRKKDSSWHLVEYPRWGKLENLYIVDDHLAEVRKAWYDERTIEALKTDCLNTKEYWVTITIYSDPINYDRIFRVKPKIVKKHRWAYKNVGGELVFISKAFYSKDEAKKYFDEDYVLLGPVHSKYISR